MRCADCGLYECALRSPLGGCPNGEAVEQTVIFTAPDTKPYNLGNGPWDKGYTPSGVPKEMLCKWYCAGECKKGLPGIKCELKGCTAWEENRISVYDLGRGGVGIMETEYKKLSDAASDLVDAVERYTKPEKGQFCHRSELLNVKNKLKKLLKDG